MNALLFDLDGTLLDTAPEFTNCLNRLLLANNMPLITVEALRPFVSQGAKGMIEFAFQISESVSSFADLKAQFLSSYAEQIGTQTLPFPGINQIITLLTEKKIVWGIVTNKHSAYSLPLLRKFPLLNQAACIVSGDTLPTSKPHPGPLLHACALLGVQPLNCWYIGDAKSDVQASQAANMRCAVAKYGYIPSNQNPIDWQADRYLTNPMEIAQLI